MSEVTTGEQLTPRESQVAALAARGLTNRQIGHQIGISANTVGNYLKQVYAKAGVQSRIELAWQFARAEMRTVDAAQRPINSQDSQESTGQTSRGV
jgi:DNA-binding NarL/FixJ family response regulator